MIRFSAFRAACSSAFVQKGFLIISCLSGLVLGACFATYCCDHYSSLMLRLPGVPLSIVGAVSVWLVPLVLSLTTAYIHKFLLFIAAFLKSFSFAISLCLCTFTFGESGWLMRLCLLHTDICTFPLLCWLWYFRIESDTLGYRLAICVALLLIISVVDYCLISPYLMKLINSI